LPDKIGIGNILWVKGAIVKTIKAKPVDYAEKAAPKDFSKMSSQEFIRAIAPYAQASQEATGVPASVTIAQAILETGWGKYAHRIPNNFFGMKGTGPAGSVVVTTREYEEGRFVVKKQRFRKYHNIEESFADHARLIVNRFPHAMKHRDNPDRFAEALIEKKEPKYATGPDYAKSLKRLMKQYDLYKYDR